MTLRIMTTKTSITNLQIISALDSLCYGMIYCFISPYILQLGGSHVHTGLLAVGNLLGELLSPSIINTSTHLYGKKYTLWCIINMSLVTHIMLVLMDSYWVTILIRVLFSLINQSQNLCLDLLITKAHSEEEKRSIHSNYSFLSGSGYIIGPIISGYLFDIGFGYTGILAAFLSLINTSLMLNVVKDDKDLNPEHTEHSALQKAANTVSEKIQELQKSNYKKHWDMIIMKYLFSSSIIIFFSKFSQILKNNYNSDNATLGYTTSFINLLVFCATYFVPSFKTKTQAYPEVFLSEVSFFLLTVFMLLACSAPYYEMYIFILVPIILLRVFTFNLWKELFAERRDEHLNKLNDASQICAGLTIPVLFGLACNKIGKDAVILFSCFPTFLCWIITRFYSKEVQIENNVNENDKNK